MRKSPDIQGESDEEILRKRLDPARIPRHVAIIMDGNGRWASSRGMPRAYGHRAGVESLRDIVQISSDIGVDVLTVYAFSTENWKRPREEIDVLMDLLVEYLNKEIDELKEKNVKVKAIGKIDELPEKTRNAVAVAHKKTQNCNGLKLNIALNYGGRAEIVDAVREIAIKVEKKLIIPQNIDQELIARHLYTSGQPDPDLLIRPSGDYRISNFLLWQLAYTEFWHTDVMWPDFRKTHFLEAMLDFQNRKRRFGGLSK
ncbi:MAG: isoprenyl transferase [Peptococcaceae bacterium]|nr:isoprenyl transferase [Peptococcaceae bacterium]